MNDKLTIEDAIAQLACLIEHYVDDRGCEFEEATTRALGQMEKQKFYFVHGDDMDGG